MILDEYMEACDELVAINLVNESERMVNLTLTLFEQEDYFEMVFYGFDVALLGTKIMSQLHPITFNCYNAGENTYKYYEDIIMVQNGYNPKNYIMNGVYNFGHIFDSIREFWLFLMEDPRGQTTNVYENMVIGKHPPCSFGALADLFIQGVCKSRWECQARRNARLCGL